MCVALVHNLRYHFHLIKLFTGLEYKLRAVKVPPFSLIDAQVIKARLKIFQTKSLEKKNLSGAAWAAEKLKGVPLRSHEDIAAEGAALRGILQLN